MTAEKETVTAEEIKVITSEETSELIPKETVTSEEIEPAPPREDEELNATLNAADSKFHGDKEWRQAETSRLEDGCHNMSLNLSKPGQANPIWKDENPGGTISARIW